MSKKPLASRHHAKGKKLPPSVKRAFDKDPLVKKDIARRPVIESLSAFSGQSMSPEMRLLVEHHSMVVQKFIQTDTRMEEFAEYIVARLLPGSQQRYEETAKKDAEHAILQHKHDALLLAVNHAVHVAEENGAGVNPGYHEIRRVLVEYNTAADIRKKMEDLECMRLIHELRADEGDAVTILCDNPEPRTSEEAYAVEGNGDWTQYHNERFAGSTLLSALKKAVVIRADRKKPASSVEASELADEQEAECRYARPDPVMAGAAVMEHAETIGGTGASPLEEISKVSPYVKVTTVSEVMQSSPYMPIFLRVLTRRLENWYAEKQKPFCLRTHSGELRILIRAMFKMARELYEGNVPPMSYLATYQDSGDSTRPCLVVEFDTANTRRIVERV